MSAYDDARASWGFPRFAKDFPRHDELDALVVAFARGDYQRVREGAPKLASSDAADDVKRAAATLRARLEPDPGSRILFGLAAALLVILAAWWLTHDRAPAGAPPAKPVPTVEHIN